MEIQLSERHLEGWKSSGLSPRKVCMLKLCGKITSEGGNTKSLCDRINLSNEQLRNNSHNEPKLSNLPTKKSRCTLQGELGSRFLVVLVLMSENRPYHEFKKPITLRSNKSMNL